MKVGIQIDGHSANTIQEMALSAFASQKLSPHIDIADIGAGRGDLCNTLVTCARSVTAIDAYPSDKFVEGVNFVKSDLNFEWNLNSNSFDFVFALEVIEHIENPRHFIRELKRILRPGGLAFVSSPNSLNFFSRVNFFLKGEHRYFQDSCYPAHITCLVKKDFERLLHENQFSLIDFYYNYEDVIPVIGMPIRLRLASFSNSVGVLFKKPIKETIAF